MSAPVITIENVAKSFGDQVVFDGLDLTVAEGEILTILGPSGAGKSVLLKLIVGLKRADRGRIVVKGQELGRLDEQGLKRLRRRIGFLFQGSALFDSLTVGENIAYPLRELSWNEPRIRARVTECLEEVGLPGIEAQAPSDLSGGMKKRVALARAIASTPEILLYDEPTTGLDPANTRRINELIVRINRRLKATSLVITHDLAAAYAVSHRVGLVKDRRVPLVVDVETAQTRPPAALSAFVRGEDANQ